MAVVLGAVFRVAAEEDAAKECALFPMELIDPALPQERESVRMSKLMTLRQARDVLARYDGPGKLEIICKDSPAWDARMPTDPRWRVRIQAD